MMYFYYVDHLYFSVLFDPADRSQVLRHTSVMAYDHKWQIHKEVRIQVKICDMYPFYTYNSEILHKKKKKMN